jgi:hypothetical protein
MSYTHTNLFEDRGFGDGMQPWFPISAGVRSYADFVHEHREFLVLGTYGAPKNGCCTNCMMMARSLPSWVPTRFPTWTPTYIWSPWLPPNNGTQHSLSESLGVLAAGLPGPDEFVVPTEVIAVAPHLS